MNREEYDEIRHYAIAWDFENMTLLGDEPNKEYPSMNDLENYATKLSCAVTLIETLRKVANAASNYVALGYLEPCHHWRQPLGEALSVLPQWVIDIEED